MTRQKDRTGEDMECPFCGIQVGSLRSTVFVHSEVDPSTAARDDDMGPYVCYACGELSFRYPESIKKLTDVQLSMLKTIWAWPQIAEFQQKVRKDILARMN